jgi:hypothetical protein
MRKANKGCRLEIDTEYPIWGDGLETHGESKRINKW